METKTLDKIQKVSKIGYIITKIVKIFSIIGICGSIAGIVALLVGDLGTMQVGDVSIHSLIVKTTKMNIQSVYASLAVSLIMCIGDLILTIFVSKYFENELKTGTPFTIEGADELKKVGIYTIIIPIISMIVATITNVLMNLILKNVNEVNYDNSISFGLGIAMIVISLLCRYGAELNNKKGEE